MNAAFGGPTWQTQLGDYVAVLAPAPDGSVVAVGSLSGESILVDAETGETIEKLAEHPFGVLSAVWSRGGDLLAVGGHDGLVRLSKRRTDGGIEEVCAIEVGGWVVRLAWSPVADVLAVATGREVVLVDGAGRIGHRYEPLASTVTDVVWSVDGRRIGAAAYGGISWYDPDDASETAVRQHRWKGSLLRVALSPDGKWACAGAQDASIHLWKLWSGDDLSMSGYPAKIDRLAFRDDSRWMATACIGELTVWDFSKKGPRGTAPASGNAHERHIEALAWQPSGDLLVTGGADGRLVLWPSPRKQRENLRPWDVGEHPTGVSGVVWRPGHDEIIVARSDGLVEARPITSGSPA